MENNKDRMLTKNFIKRIISLDIGMFLFALIISVSQGFSIWISLSLLGVLIGGIGAFLSGPGSLYSSNDTVDMHRPNESHLRRIASFIARTSPVYSFENALMFSGIIAFIVSVPFLCVIMFSG